MSWTELAACIGQPTEVFFPDHGNGAAEAKRICATCPVTAQCREAGANESYGVWGGEDLSARRGLSSKRAVTVQSCRDCRRLVETRVRGGVVLCDECRTRVRRETWRLSRARLRSVS